MCLCTLYNPQRSFGSKKYASASNFNNAMNNLNVGLQGTKVPIFEVQEKVEAIIKILKLCKTQELQSF